MNLSADDDTVELLDRAERGDVAARRALLDRHRNQLRRMVSVRLDRRLLPRLDPSDVIQEALAEAAQKLTGYLRSRPVRFYPWLRRLTWEHLVRLHEHHVKAKKRSVRREVFSLPNLPDDSTALLVNQLAASNSSPERRLLVAEVKGRVMMGLSLLSESDREILVLRFLEHLPTRQIADVLGITEGAVRARQTRALDRLVGIVDQDSE